MRRIFIVRHGQTDLNLTRKSQKGKDPPMNATGEAQCRRCHKQLIEILSHEPIDAVYYSPYKRTVQTMQILMKGLNQPKICESNTLIRHGCYKDEVENFIANVFEEVLRNDYHNILVVTHGPIVKYMINWLHAIGGIVLDEATLPVRTPRNASVTQIEVGHPNRLLHYDSL